MEVNVSRESLYQEATKIVCAYRSQIWVPDNNTTHLSIKNCSIITTYTIQILIRRPGIYISSSHTLFLVVWLLDMTITLQISGIAFDMSRGHALLCQMPLAKKMLINSVQLTDKLLVIGLTEVCTYMKLDYYYLEKQSVHC